MSRMGQYFFSLTEEPQSFDVGDNEDYVAEVELADGRVIRFADENRAKDCHSVNPGSKLRIHNELVEWDLDSDPNF